MKAHVAGNSRHRYDANQMLLDAEEMALASENPQSLFHVRYARLMYERLFGNPRKAVELSEGMSESVRSVYNISILSSLNFFRGIAFAEIGEIEEGMAILRNGIDICEKFGAHFFLGALYNSLGYCYGEICQPERAWKFNQKGAEIAHQLIEKFPMGRLQYAHTLAESKANLVENLLDQRNFDEAWKRIKGIEQETKGESFDWNRYQWESRVDYYTSQILLNRSSLDEAETIIQESLKKVRTDLMKKREGSFMCLLGGVQTKRNESNSAITNLNKAIQILKEVENPRQLWQAHCALASTFDRMGRRSEAKDQWGAASDIIKKTSERISDRELQEDFINADPIREILSKAMS